MDPYYSMHVSLFLDCFEMGKRISLSDIHLVKKIFDPFACQRHCIEFKDCRYFTLSGKTCYLKSNNKIMGTPKKGTAITGPARCDVKSKSGQVI